VRLLRNESLHRESSPSPTTSFVATAKYSDTDTNIAQNTGVMFVIETHLVTCPFIAETFQLGREITKSAHPHQTIINNPTSIRSLLSGKLTSTKKSHGLGNRNTKRRSLSSKNATVKTSVTTLSTMPTKMIEVGDFIAKHGVMLQ
jgi:hypothetical protein